LCHGLTKVSPYRKRRWVSSSGRFVEGAGVAVTGEDATIIHFKDAVGVFEVVIVVRDGDDGTALSFQFGQQFGVEEAAENGILVGGPFVEDVDGFVFELG